MPLPDDIAEIERAIQLAVAPAFLLSGIAGALAVMAGRLARLVDRERAIRAGTPALAGEQRDLRRRSRAVHRAIATSVLSAILLCTLIVCSFGGVFLGLRVARLLALLLITAMLALTAALAFFLWEVRLASRSLPLGGEP